VTEQLLNHPDGHTTHHQMARERVAIMPSTA
jgi:hypothetical protein